MLKKKLQSLWDWVWQLLSRGTLPTGTGQSGQSQEGIEPASPESAGSQKKQPGLSEEENGNEAISSPPVGSQSQVDVKIRQEERTTDENSETDTGIGEKQNKNQKQPGDIAGRRNGRKRTPTSAGNDRDAKLRISPRPELICRNSLSSSQWEVVLSADNASNIKEVRQDGQLLDLVNGEYNLSSFARYLSIIYADRKSEKFPLYNDTPLIFKMPNEWKGDGRRVSGITIGHFIVLVPKEWKRTGSAPVKPEECTDVNFAAHFFYTKKGDSAGVVGGFEGRRIELTPSGFELKGEIVFDSSFDGKLYVGAPPELKPSSGVTWARIGEESEDGWKGENFKPTERSLKDVLKGREGRFFVRVYDRKGLRDSGQFRYLRGLREIRVDGEPYSPNTILVPSSAGYSTAEVHFVCTDAAPIHLESAGPHWSTTEERTIEVEPHPQGDKISCALRSGECRVVSVIRLPRIWWRLEPDHGRTKEWGSVPLVMKPHEFRNQAHAHASIRLKLPPIVSSVRLGFGNELERVYRTQRNRNDSETQIHLSDFVDYDQLGQRLNKDISLNVQCGERLIPLIQISADAVPKIATFKSEPKEIKLGETTTLHWTIRNGESDAVSVHINDGIGAVKSNGRRGVRPMETTTFILNLKSPTVDDMKSVTVVVQNERGGKLLSLAEVRKRLKGVDLSKMAEETGFSIVDLKRYWDGECHSGEYKSPEFEMPFFVSCMSEYAIDRSRYKERARVRRRINRRRAKRSRPWMRKRKPT